MNESEFDSLLKEWKHDQAVQEAGGRDDDRAMEEVNHALEALLKERQDTWWARLLAWLKALSVRPRPIFAGVSWVAKVGLAMGAIVIALSARMLWLLTVSTVVLDTVPRAANLPSENEIRRQPLTSEGWRRAALIIGVSNYERYNDVNLPNLPSAQSDALRAADLAEKRLLIPRENTFLLRDNQATEAGVRGALLWLQQFSGPGDLVFIHVACHGRLGPEKRLRLLLSDSRSTEGFPAGALLEALRGINVVLVADVCYAGDITNALEPDAKNQWVVASASGTEETQGNKFSAKWFKALEDHADGDGNGIITLREAFEWTKNQLHRDGYDRGQLTGPKDEDVPLVLRPEVRALLPKRGVSPPPPAVLKLSTASHAANQFWLDEAFFGTLRNGQLTVKLPPGRHTVALRESPDVIALDENPRELWTDHVNLVAGETVERRVEPSAPGRPSIPVIRGEGKGLFPVVERSPSRESVSLEQTTDGIWKLSFRFAGTGDSRAQSSVAFRSPPNLERDVAGLLVVSNTQRVVVAFNARVEGAATVKFSVGDSPNREPLEAVLDEKYKAIELEVGMNELHRLGTGLHLSCEAARNPGQPVTIYLKDVFIRPGTTAP